MPVITVSTPSFRRLLPALLMLLAAGQALAAPLFDEAALSAFSQEMSQRHGLGIAQVEETLRKASRLDSVLVAIARPAEYKPWYVYRPIFLTPERVAAGVRFWQANARALDEAESRYGVPASIIVAIVGVETFYGRNVGKYRVLDALATLAFQYPPRAQFFRGELENFLLMVQEEHLDPLKPVGSYAGAFGLPQFMPSSFRAFAVDFDGDGRRDLWEDPADIVGSVANYLAQHGWQRGQPIVVAVADDPRNAQAASSKVDLVQSLGEYRRAGVRPLDEADDRLQSVLLSYEGVDAPEYWLGFQNFYAITRYNHSPKYALAVAQLAEAVASARRRGERQP